MIISYHPQSPNSFKVLLAAAYLGLRPELRMIDVFAGAQRAPRFFSLNPMAQVPVLETSEGILTESDAICWYLRRTALDADHAGSWEDASLLRWLCWGSTQLAPAFRPFQWERLFKPTLTGQPTDEAAIEQAVPAWTQVVGVLEQELARNGAWVLGSEMGIADTSLAAILMHADAAGAPLQDYERVQAWRSSVRASDAWSRATNWIESAADDRAAVSHT